MTMAPAPHDPRRPPSAAARNGYTGRNAHGFSATAPASVSGSSDGYPLTAANQYHCPSHPIARSAIVASAPKREPGPERSAARRKNAVVTPRAARSTRPTVAGAGGPGERRGGKAG